jgi:2-amino-4-hydroxy-6-hydroxymethyldihydropteridine diphosphokinase / dihydropteroate synthase
MAESLSCLVFQVAELEVPYILMHSRGAPGCFHDAANKVYSSLEAEVAAELEQAAESAMGAGIPAWNLMLDVGIGFSKHPVDSMRLVTKVNHVRKHLPGVPLCHPQSPTITRISSGSGPHERWCLR